MPLDAVDGELYPSELALLTTAVDRRRVEFTAGRLCARRALAELGFAPEPILRGTGGEPLWPARAVGSITHDDGWCAAVAQHAERLGGIGVDFARIVPLSLDVVRLYSSARELADAADFRPGECAETAVVRFSLKESVLKAIQPIVGDSIDLRDIEIDVRGRAPRVDLSSALRRRCGRFGAVHCDYCIAGGRVVSAAWMLPPCGVKESNSLFA